MELHFPLILDGATGTRLQSCGYTGAQSAEQWVLAHPEVLLELQRGYIESGSQVIYAPTFGANWVKLAERGEEGRVEEYNRRLTALSKTAANGRAWVAGDIAPTGRFLEPLGDATFEELVSVYAEQAAALEAAGVDLFAVETMMTLPEARAALLAIRSVSRKPVLVSFTCDENGRTLSGTDVTAALVVMQGMGVDAFGLNCSVGPAEMLAQLARLRPYAEVPLLAKPNAGLPEFEGGRAIYRCQPEEFSASAAEMAALGVGLFGGCCGTECGHIQALCDRLQNVKPAKPSPQYEGMLVCATEREPAVLPPDVRVGAVLSCDDTLADALEEEYASPFTVTAIAVRDETELAALAECQYAISKPLCLVCDNAALLERALRLYQGRALYDGALPESVLLPLAEKYGLIF